MLSFLRRLFGSHEFVLEIREVRTIVTKGKVLNRMLCECSECAQHYGITSGRIYGEKGPGVIRLGFSKEIPPAAHQAFRNIQAQYS
jgi:hypothetical protein